MNKSSELSQLVSLNCSSSDKSLAISAPVIQPTSASQHLLLNLMSFFPQFCFRKKQIFQILNLLLENWASFFIQCNMTFEQQTRSFPFPGESIFNFGLIKGKSFNLGRKFKCSSSHFFSDLWKDLNDKMRSS